MFKVKSYRLFPDNLNLPAHSQFDNLRGACGVLIVPGKFSVLASGFFDFSPDFPEKMRGGFAADIGRSRNDGFIITEN